MKIIICAYVCGPNPLIDWVDDEAEREGYEYADFYVDDPEQLESIIRSVQEIDSINWNNFNVTVNDEVYERAAGSISNTTILIRTLIIVIIVISAGVVALFLSFWLKSRLRETGIPAGHGNSENSAGAPAHGRDGSDSSSRFWRSVVCEQMVCRMDYRSV